MVCKRHIALFLAVLLIAFCTGCDDDDPTCPDTGPTGPLADWIGEYQTATKFGGVAGVWAASTVLRVFETGDIYYGAVLIQNPTVDADTVTWSMDDGNAHHVRIVFVTEQTDDYYWEHLGGSAAGILFTGSRQSAGEGPIDFRGIDPWIAWAGEYDTATKYGGEAGVWQTSSTLTIHKDRYIIYGANLVLHPVFAGNHLTWSVDDGNPHNVDILFRTDQTSDYYWEDLGGSASGQLFVGSRQSGASGPLDFRGLVAAN